MMAPTAADKPRVLLVDDEPAVLEGLRRQLWLEHDVTCVTDGPTALEVLASSPPFAVVMSDMRMPGMDGASLLSRVREQHPRVTRMLLTGQAELDAAIIAVNQGGVFRFLTKPCAPRDLHVALADAVAQHRLVMAEVELLEQTLRGAVRVLLDVLAIASPLAFDRAGRVMRTVREVAEALEFEDGWAVETAAGLSQLGLITLPDRVLRQVAAGEPVDKETAAIVERVPTATLRMLAHIPRLEIVCGIIRGAVRPSASAPPGARLLRLALDLDDLEQRGFDRSAALEVLRGRVPPHDLEHLRVLERPDETPGLIVEISVRELTVGMTLARPAHDCAGRMLIAGENEVTPHVLERVRNWHATTGVREPLFVRVAYGAVGSAGLSGGTRARRPLLGRPLEDAMND